MRLRARIIEGFKEVRQLSTEVEDYVDSIHKMFHDGLEVIDEEATLWEKRMSG